MNIKRILCPIDFSDFNQAANSFASMLASASGATIVYLHIAQPDVAWGAYAYFDKDKETKRARLELEETKPTIAGVDAAYAIEWGLPTERIVEFAEANEIDVIVLGTHGRTGLRRALMGSVAEAVVRNAACPVLAIKADAKVPLAG